MIKEALEFLAKLQTPRPPQTIEVHGKPFSVNADGTVGNFIRPVDPSWPKPVIQLSTLSSLAEAYKAKIGKLGNRVALHVVDHLRVDLLDLDEDEFGKRLIYASAKHTVETPFKFNSFLAAEDFLISLRASFLFNEEAVKVSILCSNLQSGQEIAVADDGVSQSLEVKAGTKTKSGMVIPAEGISLIPWRSFRDAAPVESKFLLRLRAAKDKLPEVALFDIDQKWRLDTIHSIGDWLRKHCEGAIILA